MAHKFMLTAQVGAAQNAVKDLVQLALDAKAEKHTRRTLKFAGARARISSRSLWFSINDRIAPTAPLAKRNARHIQINRTPDESDTH